MTPAQLAETAHGLIQPDEATIVVVGDASRLAPSLADLGRKVAIATPEF